MTATIVNTPTKIYDGNTTATLKSGNFSLSNLVGGEGFTVTQTVGTYNSAHVLEANSVTAGLAPATSRRAPEPSPLTTPCRPPPAVPARSRLGR